MFELAGRYRSAAAARAGSRQLDGEGHAVQQPADVGDMRGRRRSSAGSRGAAGETQAQEERGGAVVFQGLEVRAGNEVHEAARSPRSCEDSCVRPRSVSGCFVFHSRPTQSTPAAVPAPPTAPATPRADSADAARSHQQLDLGAPASSSAAAPRLPSARSCPSTSNRCLSRRKPRELACASIGGGYGQRPHDGGRAGNRRRTAPDPRTRHRGRKRRSRSGRLDRQARLAHAARTDDVSRRQAGSARRSATCASSASRPMKGVGSGGRLCVGGERGRAGEWERIRRRSRCGSPRTAQSSPAPARCPAPPA